MIPENVSEICKAVESCIANYEDVGGLSAKRLAYWVDCSERHAARMIDVWEGVQINAKRRAHIEENMR